MLLVGPVCWRDGAIEELHTSAGGFHDPTRVERIEVETNRFAISFRSFLETLARAVDNGQMSEEDFWPLAEASNRLHFAKGGEKALSELIGKTVSDLAKRGVCVVRV